MYIDPLDGCSSNVKSLPLRKGEGCWGADLDFLLYMNVLFPLSVYSFCSFFGFFVFCFLKYCPHPRSTESETLTVKPNNLGGFFLFFFKIATLFIYLFIYLFIIFSCVGSSFPCKGFL